jgi:hypothetical protein
LVTVTPLAPARRSQSGSLRKTVGSKPPVIFTNTRHKSVFHFLTDNKHTKLWNYTKVCAQNTKLHLEYTGIWKSTKISDTNKVRTKFWTQNNTPVFVKVQKYLTQTKYGLNFGLKIRTVKKSKFPNHLSIVDNTGIKLKFATWMHWKKTQLNGTHMLFCMTEQVKRQIQEILQQSHQTNSVNM